MLNFNQTLKPILRTSAFLGLCTIILLGSSCAESSGGGGGGFSSQDLGTLVETGVKIGGGDEEKAKQYGEVAGGVASLGSEVTPEQEYALGEGLALRAYGSIGPRLADETVQKYVNLVARSVALQSSRPDLQFSVAVLDTESINAFAAPGGFLFITKGALKKIQSEAELACVLGHEIAHVTERHMIQTYKRSRLFETASKTLEATSAEEYNANIDNGSDMLFNKGLDKKFEFEADTVGVQLSALTGYDPAHYLRFLDTLAKLPGQEGGLFKTHPDAGSRIRNLQPLFTNDLQGIEGVTQENRYKANVLDRLGS